MIERYYEDQAIRNEKNQHVKRVRACRVLQGFLIAFTALGFVFLFYLFSLEPLQNPQYSVLSKILYVLSGITPIVTCVLLWFFARARIARLTEEFDYVLNGTKLRIIRVVDNKRRKKFAEIDISAIESMGCVAKDSYEKAVSTPGVKKIYAVANSDDLEAVTYVLYNGDKQKMLLHVEFSSEMLREIRMSLGRELYQKN